MKRSTKLIIGASTALVSAVAVLIKAIIKEKKVEMVDSFLESDNELEYVSEDTEDEESVQD